MSISSTVTEALRNFVEAIEAYDQTGVWPDNPTLRRLADEGRDALGGARLRVKILQVGDWNNYRLIRADSPIGKDIKRSMHPERLRAFARERGWVVVT